MTTTADLPRLDRAHYVIDLMPDFAKYKIFGGPGEWHVDTTARWPTPTRPKSPLSAPGSDDGRQRTSGARE
jgi:hypothetical protein